MKINLYVKISREIFTLLPKKHYNLKNHIILIRTILNYYLY